MKSDLPGRPVQRAT